MEIPPRRAALIVNANSRRGREWYEAAQDAMEDRGIEVVESRQFRNVENLISLTERFIADGVPLIVAGGGDGTFSAIARLFVHQQTVLGVLPLGTGNAFARDLAIPATVEGATNILASGEVRPVDVGGIGDGYFLNVATVGLTTRIAQALTNEEKKRFGRFVYGLALFRAINQVKPFQAKFTHDGEVHEFETMQVVVGNGRYHAGPFPLAPHASILDGRLSMYALQSRSKVSFLKLAIRLPSGTQGDLPEVFATEFERGSLETSVPLRVTVDGESDRRTPVDFHAVPQAIRVVVPRGADLKPPL